MSSDPLLCDLVEPAGDGDGDDDDDDGNGDYGDDVNGIALMSWNPILFSLLTHLLEFLAIITTQFRTMDEIDKYTE